MKNCLLYIVGLFMASAMLCGCNQEDVPLFNEPAGVYFPESAYSYSFSDKIGVEKDTIVFTVKIFGDSVSYDRDVAVRVVEGDTAHVTTVSPDRYRILSGVVPAGKFIGSVLVEVNDGAELADSVYSVYLEIAPNAAFPEKVDFRNKVMKLELTAIRIAPPNWSWLRYYFGEYEEEWWEFICEATNKTSLPYWPGQADTETWWMSDNEFNANVALVKVALRKENQKHPDEPMSYKNGKPWSVLM